jgi:hypothetical protein
MTQEDFDDKLFEWYAHHIPVIEEYPYAGIRFLKDPDILVPPGKEHGEIGNIYFLSYYIFYFLYISFLCVCQSTNLKHCYIHMWD